jgi:hypothetical protein
MAKGFVGSGNIASTANQELITSGLRCYKVSFYNEQACTIKVNGSIIPLRAGQGFESTREDVIIKSFIIVESGINFNFVGGY